MKLVGPLCVGNGHDSRFIVARILFFWHWAHSYFRRGRPAVAISAHLAREGILLLVYVLP